MRNTATGSWVIDDAAKVKINLHRMNVERLDSKTQGTFDFSSMYTTLDLQELKSQMTLYVQLCFDNSSDTVLKVHSRENHKWLNAQSRPSANSRCFDADTLIEWIVFLVDNLYLVVGDRIALQVIGIPMGTNCAPFLANLMLFMYEFRYLRLLVNEVLAIPKDKWHNSREWCTLRKLSFYFAHDILMICGILWYRNMTLIAFGEMFTLNF